MVYLHVDIFILFIRPGVIYTFQALSEEDRKLWMDVMDGKEPVIAYVYTYLFYLVFIIIIIFQEYGVPSIPTMNSSDNNIILDDAGFNFVNKCIQTVESRGIFLKRI